MTINNQTNKIAEYSSICILLFLILYFFYGPILFSPNTYIFSGFGDGLKNYFTFVSYLNNNDGYLNFEHMNYPYGESVLFVDSHPLLAWVLKYIKSVFPSVGNYGIGIINTLILSSFFATALILLEIFKLLKIQTVLAILSSVAITILNPQALRLAGHFSLAYGFFIPLITLFILRIEKSTFNLRRPTYLFAWVTIFYFTHPYLGVISSTILIIYSLLRLIQQLITQTQHVKNSISLFLCGVLPLVLFFFISKELDSHTGRTTNPFGIYHFHAEPDTIFLPFLGPLVNLKTFLFGNFIQEREAVSYIGLTTVICLLMLIISSIFYSIKKKVIRLNENLIPNNSIQLLLITSILILCLSMLYPFRWGLESLLEKIPLIKQFRSIGRFSWVFYTISTITSILIVNVVYNKIYSKKPILALQIIVFVPLMLFYEGLGYHQQNSERIINNKNPFLTENIPNDLKKVLESIPIEKEYQALIPLPFFHNGSENFGKHSSGEIRNISYISSFHTKIPLLANMSARNSIWESKNIMQIFGSSFYEKKAKRDFPNKNPFLIILRKSEIKPAEQDLINRSILIEENSTFALYEISYDLLFFESNSEEIKHFDIIKSSLYKKNDFLVSDTNQIFFFETYNQPPQIDFDTNTNSRVINNNEYHELFKIPIHSLIQGEYYKCRFWIYNHGSNFGQDATRGFIFFNQIRPDGSHNWLEPTITPSESFEINKNWTMVETGLFYGDPTSEYLLILRRSKETDKPFFIKDFLLYNNKLMIYKEQGNNVLFKNNHRIEIN